MLSAQQKKIGNKNLPGLPAPEKRKKKVIFVFSHERIRAQFRIVHGREHSSAPQSFN